jgi:hypothetical protein
MALLTKSGFGPLLMYGRPLRNSTLRPPGSKHFQDWLPRRSALVEQAQLIGFQCIGSHVGMDVQRDDRDDQDGTKHKNHQSHLCGPGLVSMDDGNAETGRQNQEIDDDPLVQIAEIGHAAQR